MQFESVYIPYGAYWSTPFTRWQGSFAQLHPVLFAAEGLSGPTISQACATSARVVGSAAYEIETDGERCILAITCDKTSNGPHLYYPNPMGPGGKGTSEGWIEDRLHFDQYPRYDMLQTAENVAAWDSSTLGEQNAVANARNQRYQLAL